MELANDLPQTAYHDFYAKEGHVLHFEHTDPIPNRNTPESLHACVQVKTLLLSLSRSLSLTYSLLQDVFENLRAIQSAPSVQVSSHNSPHTVQIFENAKSYCIEAHTTTLNPLQMHYIPPPVTFNDDQVTTPHLMSADSVFPS